MRVFKNQWFSRFAEKECVSDEELKDAVNSLEQGRIDADLGGGVYKQRVARSGGGKAGGYRTIVFSKAGSGRSLFMGSPSLTGETSMTRNCENSRRRQKIRLR